jgi:DNA-binding response OmpR family regulator
MHVLVVEDSDRLRSSLKTALKNTGYQVSEAADGEEGRWQWENGAFDAVILDGMMPGIDGLSLLKQMRDAGHDTPVLFLTAKDTLQDRVKGLHTGADDYLTKPFELEELLARVYALCRRKYNQYGKHLAIADLVIDTEARKASRAGIEITLTAREYTLLQYLALRKGEVISRTEIERNIYDELDAPLSNAVDSAVCGLRRKLAVAPDLPPLIHTRRGMGYVITDTP